MKSHLIAAGYLYDDLDKPIVGIVNSWNEFNHGHVPQRQLAENVKASVWASGGLPIEFHTIGPCDGLAVGNSGMRFILPSREIIADSIEAIVKGHPIFDGLVMISNCDKITPGMLMAAARLKIPAIQISAGPSIPDISFAESKRLRKEFLEGHIDERKLAEGNSRLYATQGNCPYIGTANTMNCLSEALGMSLPGSAIIPANSNKRLLFSKKTGKQAVRMIEMKLTSNKILTRDSFLNALRVAAAIGGSSNYILHLPAIAAEMEIEISFEDIDYINRTTPLLCRIAPNGSQSIVELDNAGGIQAIMQELKHLLNLEVLTITGRRLGELLKEAPDPDRNVIRSTEDPLDHEGGIAILKGNLAPSGAVVKRSAVPQAMYYYRGPARVFQSEEDCIAAIQNGIVMEGDVLVVTYEGPKGGPGMREMHRLTGVLNAFSDHVALITDGRFSGADSGLVIGYVTPEAADCGPIGLVLNGDVIVIDINRRLIQLEISPEELDCRKKDFHIFKKDYDSPMLKRYQKHVNTASKGATFSSGY